MITLKTDQVGQLWLGVISIVFTVLGSISVVLRIIVRMRSASRLFADDRLILLAMLSQYAYLAEVFVAEAHGFGKAISDLDPDYGNKVYISKISLAMYMMYIAIVCLIKASITFFYARMDIPGGKLASRSRKTVCAIGATFVVSELITGLQCMPFSYNWGNGEHCINKAGWYYFMSAFQIVLDIWILYLPFETGRNLMCSRKKKMGLLFVWAVGALSMVCSCIRLYTLKLYTDGKDPSRDSIAMNCWSMMEVNLGFFCSCLPIWQTWCCVARRKAAINRPDTSYTIRNHFNNSILDLETRPEYGQSPPETTPDWSTTTLATFTIRRREENNAADEVELPRVVCPRQSLKNQDFIENYFATRSRLDNPSSTDNLASPHPARHVPRRPPPGLQYRDTAAPRYLAPRRHRREPSGSDEEDYHKSFVK